MTPPDVQIVDDGEALGRAGADIVCRVLTASPNATVIAATGDSPMGLYGELGRRRRTGELSATGVTVFQLDEYLGVPVDDPRSLLGWTLRSFVDPLAIPREQVVALPNDGDGDVDAACAAYDRAVDDAGGIDLAILGLGTNGHIGFNEPPSDADAPTRRVELSPESILTSARYWGEPDRVPSQAVTAGMAQLLAAKSIVLVASGAAKREILHRALLGPVTADVPASFLQRCRDVTVVVDREAAGT